MILSTISAIVSTATLVFAIHNYQSVIKLRNDHIRMWIEDGTLTYEDLQQLGVL